MSNQRTKWTEEQFADWQARNPIASAQLANDVKRPVKTANELPSIEAMRGILKPKRKPRVARTRNGGTWTEAAYWGRLRSALRKAFQWWKPAQDALKAAKFGNHYMCESCKHGFTRKQVQIDHRFACGELTKLEHLPQFVGRLTCESPEYFTTLCKSCHQVKTNAERKKP